MASTAVSTSWCVITIAFEYHLLHLRSLAHTDGDPLQSLSTDCGVPSLPEC